MPLPVSVITIAGSGVSDTNAEKHVCGIRL